MFKCLAHNISNRRRNKHIEKCEVKYAITRKKKISPWESVIRNQHRKLCTARKWNIIIWKCRTIITNHNSTIRNSSKSMFWRVSTNDSPSTSHPYTWSESYVGVSLFIFVDICWMIYFVVARRCVQYFINKSSSASSNHQTQCDNTYSRNLCLSSRKVSRNMFYDRFTLTL